MMSAEKGLREKTIRGVGWSFADSVLGQGITFLVGLVLARLLSPEEYGLIGIITIFIVVFQGLVDSGFSNALIRKKEVTDEDYSTMFITNMAVSIVLFFVLFSVAPSVARFFRRPELVPLTRVMGLLLIINALSIMQVTVLTKRIDFKTKAKASLLSAAVSGVVGIGMAVGGCGVWSLAGQQLTRQMLYTASLWILNRWHPKLRFRAGSFRYMWGFGWKMMLSGLLGNVWNQLYQVVVGKCYSPATLGQYSRSKEYAAIFSSNLTGIVQRVSFPALAEIQNDGERLVAAYRKVIRVTMFVTAVCMIPLGAVAGPLLYCLIGPQWQQAAGFLPLICLSMSLYPLHAINLNMLQVQGRSDLFLALEVIKKVIAVGPVCLGIFVNIYWMLAGSVVTGIIAFFLNSHYTGKTLHYSSLMQLKDIAPSYGLAFLMAAAVYFLKYLPVSDFIILPLQLLTGAGVFFAVCEWAQTEEYREVKGMALQYSSKILHRNNHG